MKKDDVFEMPQIHLSEKRKVNELVGKKLQHDYYFSQIYEIIKLDIDETGVKLENKGVIQLLRCKKSKLVEKKYIILDNPFWIVMRESESHPYFVAFINSTK